MVTTHCRAALGRSALRADLAASVRKQIRALACVQAPVFLGEHCNAGLLKFVVQVAVACRYLAHRALTLVGLRKLAPYPSYLAALRAAQNVQHVCKCMQREVAYVTFVLAFAVFCVARLAWVAYQNNRYLMV